MKKLLLSITCLLLLACDTRTGPELVVEKSFAAIKTNNWAAYKDIMMTPVTYEMRLNKVSGIKQSMTYQDAEFKPIQITNMQRQFSLAVAGCTGCTALRNTDLEEVKLVRSASMESLLGGVLPYDIYQITVEVDGVETVVNYPRFAIINAGGLYYVMGLILPNEDFESSMYGAAEAESEEVSPPNEDVESSTDETWETESEEGSPPTEEFETSTYETVEDDT